MQRMHAQMDTPSERPDSRHDLASELLAGVDAIATYCGQPVRRIRHLIRQHDFPAVKKGGLLYSRRSWIDRYFGGAP